MDADFVVSNHGSVCTVRPLTEEGREWLDLNCCPEPWQWFGGAMACEPRCLPDLLEALRDDGFSVGA